jgi:hypothetical protein
MPGTVWVTDRATGKEVPIASEDVASAIASGQYVNPGTVAVHRPGIDTYAAPDVAAREQAFSPAIDPAIVARETGHRLREQEHSGVGSGAKALVGSAIGGASAGLVSPFEEDQEFHPITSGLGTLAGAIAPALVGDEAGLAGLARFAPTSLVSRAGGAVAERFGGGILGGIAGGATEGGLFGLGQSVHDLATDPLAVEHIGSTLSSNMLYGAAFGGALGGAGKALESGLQRARGAVQEFADRQGVAQQLLNTGAVDGDLVGLDAKGLRAAREAELDRLSVAQDQARAAARSAAVDDAVAYRRTVKGADPWLAIGDTEEAAPLYKATRSLRNAMDDVKGLREDPSSLLKPLRVEEQALEHAVANREAIATKLEQTNQKIAQGLSEQLSAARTAPEQVRAEILAGKVEGYVPSALGPRGLDNAVERVMMERYGNLTGPELKIDLDGKAARRYASYTDTKLPRGGTVSVSRDEAQNFLSALQRGDVSGEGQQALARLPELLDQNRALQTKIKDSVARPKLRSELSSDRIAAIDNAQDLLRAPKPEPSPGAKLLSHVGYGAAQGIFGHIPIVGHALGALVGARVADAVTGAMGKAGAAAAEASKRAATAAAAFLDTASRGAAKAPLATRVLASLRYGPSDTKGEESPRDLPGLFKARTDEIKRQVEIAPDGSFQMRPEARAAMAKNFDGIRPQNPILADQLEAYAARKIAWLASQIPRMPDAFASSLGAVKWQPSDLEMRSFTRKAHAAEHPLDVFDRVLSGHVTPEDVQTMRAVHPEMLNAYIADVSANIGSLRKSLPYSRKLSLSILTGVPVDPAMHPAVLSVLQAQFAAEPGSMSGTQAPKPQPQFGSLKRSPDAPTPAQTRGQGAHA